MSAEATAALVTVADYLDVTVPAVVADSASTLLFDLDGPIVRHVDVRAEVTAPVRAGERLGTISVVQNGRLIAQVPVVAGASIPAPDLEDTLEIWLTRLWRRVSGEGALQAEPVRLM